VIASLRGKLRDNDGETIVVEVGGVGYQVFVSAAALGALPATDADVFLYVHSHFVKDDPIRLYGFMDAAERGLFQTLIDVQGVGPRVALAILAGLAQAELVRAISQSDIARLTQIKGVGRKTAERLALELRDKITALPLGGRGPEAAPIAAPGVPTGPLGEVYGALLHAGYKPGEFAALVEKMDAKRPVADLLREALAALRRK
jgi:holliday junction DNA helicase RuvA